MSLASLPPVLPALITAVPNIGRKVRGPSYAPSGDALAFAQLADQSREQRRLLVIVCADPLNTSRLAEEISWLSPDLRLRVLPDWETLPYDHFSPHQDLVSDRLATLYQITQNGCDAVLISATSALARFAPPEYLAAFTFFLKQGQKLDLDRLRTQLTFAGYQHVTQVVAAGEYCVRGGLIDLFPMGSALPYRIDMFGDEIESIKSFDVDTQRTIYPVGDVRLLPAREFPFDDAGRTKFRQRFREVFEGDPSKSQLYKDVSNGIAPAGIEYYLPLFFDRTAPLTAYLPNDTIVCLHGEIDAALAEFWRDTESRFRLLRADQTRPLLTPTELFLPPDEWFALVKPFSQITFGLSDLSDDRQQGSIGPLPDLGIDRKASSPVAKFQAWLDGTPNRVLLSAESLGRRETMLEYLTAHGLKPIVCNDFRSFLANGEHLMLTVSPLQGGFAWSDGKIAIVTETELYAGTVRRPGKRDARRSNVDAMLRDLSEVKIGDPVVHEQHGIGRYHGLVSLDLGDGATEFLHLEYADETTLYVPVSSLHLISRYSGASPEAAPLHVLGSGQWEKAKRKAAQQARDTAAELLNLYAQRAAREGYAFTFSPHDYDAFAAGFGFEETPDQAAAIDAVVKDLMAGKPMDRLVCGDVGFGKTEVALRAAFVAFADGKQVAVLVPTTLLAEQHFQTFSDRFADWPVKIAELSRFRSAKEVKSALEGLSTGDIDIVIGTHKLIQPDVQFKNLGLVIIDEEHRFGVRQKERLKRLRAEVDVLALTATPIPRTLAMSLEGLRDFSVIATAPQRRLAIKTFISVYSMGVIREACLRELKRGGQTYFLHNEIDTIEVMRDKLAELVPEARIAVAHGQMTERELEQVMREFYQQRCNLLLCSTIIETGIDVPSANTIIINRADKFGLAQLHQLRGRVGRSHHQAYAYLLTPGDEALRANAKKRLEAIQMMEELGSGFFLAMHDLEIRGAGEVLGDEQSGEMQQIGFQLYSDMLNAAVSALRSGREPDLSQPLGVATEINLHSPALLPDSYCSDVHERLVLYKRLANSADLEELAMMQEELVDRFGVLPEQAQALVASHRLRIRAKALGISKIDAGPERSIVQMTPKPPFDPIKVINLIQRDQRYRLAGQDKLRIERAAHTLQARVALMNELFDTLSG